MPVLGIAWIAARTADPRVTVIDHLKSWASRRSISLRDQNPESARTVVGPAAPARRRFAASSSTKRSTPREDPADPLRMRAPSTSPVSARAASSG